MYVDMFPRMEIVDYKLGVLPPHYRDNHAGNIAILRTCHYLAGMALFFFGGVIIFSSCLGEGHIFFQNFLGEGHNFLKYFY